MNQDLIHGGAIDVVRASYPDAEKPWIDLSTGINPWPYPDTTVSDSALSALPTATAQKTCTAALSRVIGAPMEATLLAPGSEILIRLLPDIIQPRRVAILPPTYSDHKQAWQRSGAEIVETRDPLEVVDSVDAIVITHPNNPDGRCFSRAALEQVRTSLAARGGWLILDEAYADLIPAESFAPQGGTDGLIVLRSFGKFFGLAGLRLGAVIAPPRELELFAHRLGVWPISTAALEIGTRAYNDQIWQSQMRATLNEAASSLRQILSESDLTLVGGTDLFQLVEVADANVAFDHFAKAGLYVRRFDWSRTHLRLGLPPNPDAVDRLKSALSLLA